VLADVVGELLPEHCGTRSSEIGSALAADREHRILWTEPHVGAVAVRVADVAARRAAANGPSRSMT
jgi:hypothetical protein